MQCLGRDSSVGFCPPICRLLLTQHISTQTAYEWLLAGRHLIAGGVGFGERIDHPHAGASNPVLVAADHGQIVNQCRRRQEGIEGGHRLQQAQTTPLVGHTLVHRQDAISKLGREALEPFLQGPCLGLVAHPNPLNTLPDLTEHQHTHIKFFGGGALNPVAHPGITAIRFPEFAQDVGVEQEAHHSSMGRSSCGPRTKSLSSPTLGIESKYSLNEGFFLEAPTSAARRMRRCSSSIDTPCWPARSLSFFTTFSSICLTINCGIMHQFSVLLSMIARTAAAGKNELAGRHAVRGDPFVHNVMDRALPNQPANDYTFGVWVTQS